MPGIAGIISRRSPNECQRLVDAMIGGMKYEPFYASGTYFAPDIGVYGGWVAHEGSFAARQSVHSDRNDTVLLFSGERSILRRKLWRSACSCESVFTLVPRLPSCRELVASQTALSHFACPGAIMQAQWRTRPPHPHQLTTREHSYASAADD